MKLTDIIVDSNLKSKVKYGTVNFPFEIYIDKFEEYDIGFIRWHWHNEVQFALMEKGSAELLFLNESQVISEGEGIFINSNTLHQINPMTEDSVMITLVFNPILISGHNLSSIDKNYVLPIINSENIKFLALNKEGKTKDMISKLTNIYEIYRKKEFAYELEIKSLLCSLWMDLGSILLNDMEPEAKIVSYDEKRIKTILEYMHKNYHNKLSLSDIADSVYISKSECCRIFKKYLKMTPFEYLMQYRVIKASDILESSNNSISDIASSVGFNDSSYFSKTFKRFMNISPKDYRKLKS